jgi:hypothetical protein
LLSAAAAATTTHTHTQQPFFMTRLDRCPFWVQMDPRRSGAGGKFILELTIGSIFVPFLAVLTPGSDDDVDLLYQ